MDQRGIVSWKVRMVVPRVCRPRHREDRRGGEEGAVEREEREKWRGPGERGGGGRGRMGKGSSMNSTMAQVSRGPDSCSTSPTGM